MFYLSLTRFSTPLRGGMIIIDLKFKNKSKEKTMLLVLDL